MIAYLNVVGAQTKHHNTRRLLQNAEGNLNILMSYYVYELAVAGISRFGRTWRRYLAVFRRACDVFSAVTALVC